MGGMEAAFSEIEAQFEANLSTFNAPGVVICFTDRERTLRVVTFGYADMATGAILTPETSFPIGSIGKSFACIAALALSERGALDLETPVADALPWLEPKSAFEPMRLQHLMTHTGGLPRGSDATISAYSEAWALRDLGLRISPGDHFHYSNTGYKIVGLILERTTGWPADQALRRLVLEPLGMDHTDAALTYETRGRCAIGYQPFHEDRPLGMGGILAPAPWVQANSADGSIASTANDMAKYMRMLLTNGRGVLSKESFATLTRPRPVVPDGEHGERYAYGLSITQAGGRTRLGHGGGTVGFRAHMLVDLDDGLGVTILANGPWDPEPWAIYALERLGAEVRGEEQGSLPPDRAKIENPDQYVGEYAAAADAFSIAAQGGRLSLVKEGLRIRLQRHGEDVFYADHSAYDRFPFRFGRKGGEVVEAQHGSRWYLKDSNTALQAFEYPAEWDAYSGKYASHNPWFPCFRVVVHKGRLLLVEPSGEQSPLVPVSGGGFRVGQDARSPERLTFGMFVDGRPHQAKLSGDAYHRSFTP
jgi:D-alanyl-D-alanine carboxypeptidase